VWKPLMSANSTPLSPRWSNKTREDCSSAAVHTSSADVDNSLRWRFAHALPSCGPDHSYAEVGVLMSYGSSQVDAYRRAGNYAGRILKGETPANMPVELATKLDLVINLATAKALDLTIPPNLLALADEVIE
jgi:ABC-type uncharacterized transport system substrate-binding protein